jgi:hypothetical protein
LSEAVAIAATVVPIDGDRVLVRLDADVRTSRTQRLAGGGALAGGGLLIGGALAAIGASFHFPELGVLFVSALPAGGAAVGGYAIARSQLNVIARVKLGLEQAIDKLEYGSPAGAPSRLDSPSIPALTR